MTKFISRFTQLIKPERCEALARETRWKRRQGKISPFEFLYSLVLGQWSALTPTLSAQAGSFSEPVSPQAVHQRYTPAATQYFQAAFGEVLRASLDAPPESPMTQQLQRAFSAIRLFDSTHCACADALAEVFPACGGGGSTAGLKVLLSYEYGQGLLEPLALLPGKKSDQGLADLATQRVGVGELGLFDKGFYKACALRWLSERGAYFVIPWPQNVKLAELGPAGTRQPLNLASALKATSANCVEWTAVELGQSDDARLGPVRLVAFRLSPESAGRRRAHLREKCRTYGRQPTAEALELAGWWILLTNAPADRLPAPALAYVYRTRWQIELIFKQFKSVLRLDVLPSANPARVQCEVWARLLCAVLVFVCYQHANAAALRAGRGELSFVKVAQRLQQEAQGLATILFQNVAQFAERLAQIWRKLLKLARKDRRRKRRTTWQNLCEHWLELLPA